MSFLIVFSKTVNLLLTVISYAMFIRAILPFFMDVEESRFYTFLVAITEPFIIPVRTILYKLNIGQNSPIDIAFMLTYLLIALLQWFLPIV